ncbi:MAG TPA: hypothetical protein VFC78_17420 [Tepidisphaeraceae bacterium]|nr:hypothetical protein [Tepidisphaeraceae bacterium]
MLNIEWDGSGAEWIKTTNIRFEAEWQSMGEFAVPWVRVRRSRNAIGTRGDQNKPGTETSRAPVSAFKPTGPVFNPLNAGQGMQFQVIYTDVYAKICGGEFSELPDGACVLKVTCSGRRKVLKEISSRKLRETLRIWERSDAVDLRPAAPVNLSSSSSEA